jgi:RHS repeat-associated protein
MQANSQEASRYALSGGVFPEPRVLSVAHNGLLLLAFLWIIVVPRAFTQTYLQDVSVPQNGGTVPVELGYVNLPTGELHLDIPLGTIPQRGGGTGKVSLLYTSNLHYNVFGSYFPFWARSGSVSWGFSTPGDAGYPLAPTPGYGSMTTNDTCGYYSGGDYVEEPLYYDQSNYYWVAPDGSAHEFQVDYYTPYDSANCPFTPYGTSAFDQFGYYFSTTDGVIHGPDGTTYTPTKVDPNGNYYSTSGYSVTDTLGRGVPSVTVDTDGTWHVAVPNAQGGTSSYTVKWETINVHTNFSWTFGGNPVSEYSGSPSEISEIDLPDGTAYHFYYDSGTTAGHYGEMTSLVLPTGGTINYGYSNGPDFNGMPVRWLTSRTTPDSSSPWTYSTPTGSTYDCGTGCTTESFTVTAPSGDHSVHTFAFIPSEEMEPTETQYYDSSSNLLGTAYSCYFESTSSYAGNSSCPSVSTNYGVKSADIMTLPVPGGNVTTMKQYDRDSYMNLTSLKEWNFGSTLSGAPDRTTSSTYYNNGFVVNKPATITVTNSSGGLVAKTVNTYDGSSLVTSGASGIVNHDDSNYGSSFTARGNLTQVQQYTSSTAYTTKSITYDITGQMRTLTDGNGNGTTYSYTDNFFNDAGDSSSPSSYSPSSSTNAYLTSVTQGGQTSTFGYYFGTGQMAKSTDPNSQTTFFHFYDSLSRPTSTTYPDSGWSYLVYPSASETQVDKYSSITGSSLTTSCSTSGNACRHDKTLLDSLGRTSSAVLVSDPSGSDTTAATYDQNGRAYQTSNPYRSTSDSTYGSTTLLYDGLNRVAQIQDQDGSNAYTYYGATVSSNGGRSGQMCTGYGVGYPILSKDEAGKLRQSWVDSFGRLIEVDEPDPSTGSLTSGSPLNTCYAYDLNNNLTGVSQSGSRNRSFTYDMASRLVCSANPEIKIATCPSSPGSYTSGTIAYSYDNNGNLTSKQAPKENQPPTSTATVTTTYVYDALNRLTKKYYDDSITATVYFNYDGLSQTGCSVSYSFGYAAGRRTSMCDPAGNEAWSYDKMGRVLNDQRVTNSQTKTTTYTYNHDGSIATLAYPSGRTVTYTPNSAQQMVSAVDVAHSLNFATSATYAPPGELQTVTNGSSLASTFLFNKRLQSCWTYSTAGTGLSASTACTASDSTPGNIFDVKYNFNLGSNDNGNLAGITNNVSGQSGRSQTFTYDNLNRLNTATTTATYSTSPTFCWGEQYTIDAWGSLYQIGSAGSSYSGCTQEGLNLSPTTQNRLSTGTTPNFSYDVAGNMINDINHNYFFDAEGHILQVDGSFGTCSTAADCYVYDGDGNRVEKTTGSPSKLYWYGSGGNVLDETDGSGSTSNSSFNEYVFFNSRRIARMDSSANVSFYFGDHLGNTRVITNASGAVCYDTDNYPFGGQRSPYTNSCSWTNNYKFTGKERDPGSEGGNDYFGARYYASSTGRFLSPDWIDDAVPIPYADTSNPQSMNLYSYAGNNPITRGDADGHTYNVCPPGADPGSTRCTNIEDKVFEAEENQDRANGVSFANGTITDNGVVQGTFTHDPDIWGDPGANISAMGRIGNEGMSGIKVFAAGSVVLGPGAGLGLSAVGGAGLTGLGLEIQGGLIVGPYGGVSVAEIMEAIEAGGETVEVITDLGSAPSATGALSTATGEGAEGLASQASGGTRFVARIPRTLLRLLERKGLAFPSRTMMGGNTAVEIRFLPQVAKFIAPFFK